MHDAIIWILTHQHQFYDAAAGVIGGASIVVKGCEAICDAAAKLWPEASKAEGPLNAALGFLDRIAKSPLFNLLALNSTKSAPKP